MVGVCVGCVMFDGCVVVCRLLFVVRIASIDMCRVLVVGVRLAVS